MNKISNVLWGIILIIIGIILWLNALEITNIIVFFDGWWTLFIIVPSINGIIKDKDKVGNIFGLFIGIAVLLICQNIIDFDLLWKLIIPTALILVGLSLIFKSNTMGKIKKEINKITKSKTIDKSYCSTFSSMNIKLDDEEVDKYELNAIFGELIIDLTEIKIKKDILITACSVFGNTKIIVPEDIEVKVLSTSILGDISDKRKKLSSEKKKTIYIDATAIFGGVEIKWQIYKGWLNMEQFF